MPPSGESSAPSPAPAPAPERNWAELPSDMLSLIFKKLGILEVLYPAGAVCRAWSSAATDPELWRSVDMRSQSNPLFYKVIICHRETIARKAIDRAASRLEEFYSEGFCSDDLLRYIADRTTILKCLCLISCYYISEEGLLEFLRRSPMLQELELTFSLKSEKLFECVGRACPQLKCLRANTQYSQMGAESIDDFENLEALAIAKTMPQLQKLQLVGNLITSKGLLAILDDCIHLESLDIRGCYNVQLDENLRSRLARIKDVRLPFDSTHDYGFPVHDIVNPDNFEI